MSSLLMTSSHSSLPFPKPHIINDNFNNNNNKHFISSLNPNYNNRIFKTKTTIRSLSFRIIVPSAFSGESPEIPSVNRNSGDDVDDDEDNGTNDKTKDGAFTGFVDEWGEKSEFKDSDSDNKIFSTDLPRNEDEWGNEPGSAGVIVVDEWGERSDFEGVESTTKLSEADTPRDDGAYDEWGKELTNSSSTGFVVDEWGEKSEIEGVGSATKLSEADPPRDVDDNDEWGKESRDSSSNSGSAGFFVDEWGERSELEGVGSATGLWEADSPRDDDEWGKEVVNSSSSGDGRLGELKRCLVDSVYGTEFGFRATVEMRAEIVELVNQLEVSNPIPSPTENASLLNGNWVLLYTAFSELLPLVAAGRLPCLKLKKISQEIDVANSTIQNSATFSSPFASLSFSAVASFEVRSPTRIQVEFKEGILRPPELSSSIDLPQNIDIFGQKIDLLPLQQALNPLQEAVANAFRLISGQPPLKVPIPGEGAQSWLVTTYLDDDLRISRGDGGLFVLAREGSSLIEYQ